MLQIRHTEVSFGRRQISVPECQEPRRVMQAIVVGARGESVGDVLPGGLDVVVLQESPVRPRIGLAGCRAR